MVAASNSMNRTRIFGAKSKPLQDAGEARWQDSEPGQLRHRRGGSAVRSANAGGAESGGQGSGGATAYPGADERRGAAAGASGGADAARG
eukprot:scaffold18443_cov63-Phaeocystis_antarctica.AAC.1